MKNILLILGCTLACLAAYAQPVFDSAYAPSPGRAFTYYQDNEGVANLSDGPNQMWTCTFSNPSLTQYDSVLAGTDANPISPLFRQANRRIRAGTATTSYFNVSQAGLLGYGSYTNGAVLITISPPATYYAFPLTYGQQQIRQYDAVINSAGSFSYQRSYDTLTYTGYGNATVNGVPYANCVLITTRSKLYLRSDTNAPFTNPHYSTSKSVYAPGFYVPIAKYTLIPAGSSFARTAYFVTYPRPATAMRSVLAHAGCAVWPNPAQSQAHIILPGVTGYDGMAAIYTAMGGHVADLPIRRGMVDLTSLAPNLYFMQVENAGVCYRARVVKK